MPAPVRPLSALLRTHAGTWIALALLATYAVMLGRLTVVTAGGSDSSGYFNVARELSRGELRVPPRELPGLPMAALPPYAYVPLGYVPDIAQAQLTPTYPAGLPLLYLASAGLAGWETGPFLVLFLHALAGVVVTYLLARASGLAPPLAALGATAVAASPLHLMFSVHGMSDVPAMVWCALALLGAMRGGRCAAVGAGFALGLAVLIRPTNLLLGLPLLLAFGRDWRRLLLCGAGGLPAAIFLGWYNVQAYGAALTTGYGDVSTAFGFTWVGASLRNYAHWLPLLFSPLLLFAAATPWVESGRRHAVLVHAVWVLTLGIFYSTYYHTQETWWYLRFLLPACPSLVILAALGASRLSERLGPRMQAIAWAAAFLLIVLNGRHWSLSLGAHLAGRHERIYPAALALIEREVPARSVVLCMQVSGMLHFATDHTIVRWEQVPGVWPEVKTAATAAGRPVYAALFSYEVQDGFAQRVPGPWRKIAEHEVFSLWQLDPAAP